MRDADREVGVEEGDEVEVEGEGEGDAGGGSACNEDGIVAVRGWTRLRATFN